MIPLVHWIERWRNLAPEEREARVRAVVDRLARRSPRIRALGLVAEVPGWPRLARELSVPLDRMPDLLRADDPRRGPLFGTLASRVAGIVERRPDHVARILEQAGRVLDNRFSLLGHPVARRVDGSLDWHRDPVSGGDWPAAVYHLDVPIVRGDGSDVKYPWELSRGQHLLALSQAWWFAPTVADGDAGGDLRRLCAARIVHDLYDWIRDNPRGLGVNWTCTMEVAIRAFVWTAVLALMRGAPEFDDRLLRELVRSLWLHGRHIRAHLERNEGRPSTNHYLSDLVGLMAIAGALPELGESAVWHRLAHDALADEIDRQVHEDGVDFERSVPYHRLATELFLHAALLARAAGRPFGEPFERRLAAMLEFVACYTRPDGSAPQWGDNDDGRLLPLDGWADPEPHDHRHLLALGGSWLARADLVARAEPRDVEARWLIDGVPPPADRPDDAAGRSFDAARVYVMRALDLHLFVNCAPVGTAGLGNHTHNDVLSPCVWAAGTEWITDPGSGSYTGQPALRNRLRATAAHATLQLGDREQNAIEPDTDGLFRVAERARPEVLAWRVSAERVELSGRHRGFGRPDEPWVHERTIVLDRARRHVWIVDRLERDGGESARAEAATLRLPLGPRVEVVDAAAPPRPADEALLDAGEHEAEPPGEPRERRWIVLRDDRYRIARVGFDLPHGSRIDVVSADHSPGYGTVVARRSIEVALAPHPSSFRARSVLVV
ncbi:MAG TPA: alginate lyase family protein [Candidatus Polarisedimenticolaceae bacterium]|nr:alginate lyase family protein [Candidatus Polarisedimenticolaceae bacterium]